MDSRQHYAWGRGLLAKSIGICGSITHHVKSHGRVSSKKGNYSLIPWGGLKIIIIITITIFFTDIILLRYCSYFQIKILHVFRTSERHLLQTELHTYKLPSYSWLCKYPTRDKQMNTDLTQQIQTRAVMKSSHLSSGICLLWLGFLFPHFLSPPNIESTLFKKSSTEKVPTLLLHPQAAGLWSTVTA